MADQSDQNLLSGLMALLQKPEVKDMWFNKKEITLDGYRFVSCRFDQCRLFVSSSNFELEQCFISPDTVIVFGPEVVKPIRLFNRLNNWVYEKIPYFAPVRNQDGTISVRTW